MCWEVPWQSRIAVGTAPPKLEGFWLMTNAGGHIPQENLWRAITPRGELACDLETLGPCTLLATIQDKNSAHLPCCRCIQPFICLPIDVASLGRWAGLHIQVPGQPWWAITIGVKWKGCPRGVLVNQANSGIASLHAGHGGIPWRSQSPRGRFSSFTKFLLDPFPMPQLGPQVLSQGWRGVYLKGPVGLPSRPGRVEKVTIRAPIFPSGYLDRGGEHAPTSIPRWDTVRERWGGGKCGEKTKENKSKGARERHGADFSPPEVLSGQG